MTINTERTVNAKGSTPHKSKKVGDDYKRKGEYGMADDVTKNEQAQAQPEPPKEPTLDELKARIAALEAEKQSFEQSNANQKKAINEACTDAAEWKRKYRATLDEAERAKQEQADRVAEMEAKIATYEAERRTSSYFAKLVDAGYDTDTAKVMASGLPDGVTDAFFTAHKAFLENKTKELKAQAINAQPSLPTGAPLTTADAQKIEQNKTRAMFGLPPI